MVFPNFIHINVFGTIVFVVNESFTRNTRSDFLLNPFSLCSPHVLQLVIGFFGRTLLVPLFRVDVVLLQGLFGQPPPIETADVDDAVPEV